MKSFLNAVPSTKASSNTKSLASLIICLVQVTNFKCGGYSVGISCSIVLADLLVKEKFIKKWSNIHEQLLPKSGTQKVPIFFFPKLKPTTLVPMITPNQTNHCGHTLIFNFPTKGLDLKDSNSIALFCIEEAEAQIGREASSKYTLVAKESLKVLRIQNGQKHEVGKSKLEIKRVSWEEFGISEVSFCEGNKAAHASHWIGPTIDALVMAMPSHSQDAYNLDVFVTIPFQNCIC